MTKSFFTIANGCFICNRRNGFWENWEWKCERKSYGFFTSPPLSLLLFQLFSEKNVYSKLARFCITNQTKKKKSFDGTWLNRGFLQALHFHFPFYCSNCLKKIVYSKLARFCSTNQTKKKFFFDGTWSNTAALSCSKLLCSAALEIFTSLYFF